MKKAMRIVFMLILFVILAILIVMFYFETGSGKSKKAELLKTGASEVISQVTGKDVDVQEFMDDKMSQEDAAYVNEILEEKVDLNTVTDIVSEYQKTGSVDESVVDHMTGSFTEQEKEKMKDLYQKYGDDFLNYIQ